MNRGALLIAGVATLSAIAGPATASSPVTHLDSGSWWQVEPAGGQIPPPPNVPPKGLWVDSSPNGEAISAIRFTLSGASAPVLHLRVHQPATASAVDIVACVTSSTWQAATAGPWASRPQADCAHGQTGTKLQGAVLTVDLSGLPAPASATYDIVLQPAPAAAGTPAAPFDITFEQPVPSDISSTPYAPEPQAPLASPVDGSAAPSPVTPDAAPVALAPPATADLGPALPSAVVSPPLPAAPTAPVTVPRLSVPRSVRPRLAAVKLPGQLSRRSRYLMIVMLFDVVAWLYLRSPLGTGGSRAALTLYDTPESLPDAAERAGRAPSLR